MESCSLVSEFSRWVSGLTWVTWAVEFPPCPQGLSYRTGGTAVLEDFLLIRCCVSRSHGDRWPVCTRGLLLSLRRLSLSGDAPQSSSSASAPVHAAPWGGDSRHASEQGLCFLCSGCEKTFITVSALFSHNRAHFREQELFSCSFPGCSKQYDKACRLKIHLRSHTGEKPGAPGPPLPPAQLTCVITWCDSFPS